jgi:hypothetical protein
MMVMTVGAIMIGVTAMVVMAINSFLVNLPSPPITHCLPSCHLVFHCLPNCFFIAHYFLGHSIVIHHLLNHLVSLL